MEDEVKRTKSAHELRMAADLMEIGESSEALQIMDRVYSRHGTSPQEVSDDE